MIEGAVTPFREAVIPLPVFDATGGEVVFQAVIDTGFSDYLTLPPQAIRTLGLPEGGSMRVSLADNSETDLQVYAGTVSWDGRSRDITILAAEGVPLIGMSLLYGFELRIRTIDGGSVTITSLTGPSTP